MSVQKKPSFEVKFIGCVARIYSRATGVHTFMIQSLSNSLTNVSGLLILEINITKPTPKSFFSAVLHKALVKVCKVYY